MCLHLRALLEAFSIGELGPHIITQRTGHLVLKLVSTFEIRHYLREDMKKLKCIKILRLTRSHI